MQDTRAAHRFALIFMTGSEIEHSFHVPKSYWRFRCTFHEKVLYFNEGERKESSGMAILQIKGIDEAFYTEIKQLAASENRTISQQVLFIIKEYLIKYRRIHEIKTPAEVLLDLAGSWIDTREADQIVDDIRKKRRNSRKLSKGF
jgi:hypothetical protein